MVCVVVATLALFGGSSGRRGGHERRDDAISGSGRRGGVVQNDAFINHVYQDLLGRPADPAGLDYWSSVLSSGVPRARSCGRW